MTIREPEFADLATPTGLMRTHLFRPQGDARHPGIVFYSEIFQVTAPIRRTAAFFAGHGFVVAVPEIYHEFEPAGTVLAYDTAGADRGNALKREKELSALDGDSRAALDFLAAHPACDGHFGALGICLGGHLSYRAAAVNADVKAAACFYGTDIHSGTLCRGGDDTIGRTGDIRAELLLVFGRQDPHIPLEGRKRLYDVLTEKGVSFTWHEFNAAHAFIRDEGVRYDPVLATQGQLLAVELFQRCLR